MTVPAKLPKNEAARIEALHRYAILDTDSNPEFDRIVGVASRQFDVPIALVSLVDEDRQWFKASCGLSASETSRDVAFCAHAILAKDVFVVLDATKDDRFKDNPLVREGLKIRFYAGAPLLNAEGLALGTLCIIDDKPRAEFSDADKRLLSDLANVIVDHIEMRYVTGVELEQRKRFTQAVLENIHDGVVASTRMATYPYLTRPLADFMGSIVNRSQQNNGLMNLTSSRPMATRRWRQTAYRYSGHSTVKRSRGRKWSSPLMISRPG